MKKYYILLLLFILSSCDSFFHEVDKSYLKVDTQEEKDDMINGIYARLVLVHNSSYFTIQGRSDDNIRYSSKPDYWKNSGVQITDEIYFSLYGAVININKMLRDVSEQDDRKLLGELYFLRAYCYFKLARVFGTPPLVKDLVVNFYLEKPSYREVYEFIESDLLKAIKLLPNTYTDARIPGETPHKGTAKALLAEVYLNMAGFPVKDESKYAEAAKLSAEVIEQAEYYNFALQSDFAALWDEHNKHDKENIFGLFFNSEWENNWNDIGGNDLEVRLDKNSNGPQSLRYTLTGVCHPSPKFYDDFPYNYRKLISFTTGYYRTQNYEFLDSTSYYNLQFIAFNPSVDVYNFSKCFNLKWAGDCQQYFTGPRTLKPGTTLYLLRYAQTLLTYAEAKARSGKLDQSAYEAVNKIRRRANHLDLNTPSKFDLPANLTTEQFIDSVVWERAWELSCEPDGRWFDIIRLDLKDQISGNMYPKEDTRLTIPESYLTNDWYFYKIPQEDRWANPNFE